jgi:NAD(P)-dependent dehydrogenase (short-subunit alcohol dehydrogenase family)
VAPAWTAEDVPPQTGRVAVVTGANSGIGFEVARVLAARGARVELAVRDPGRGARAAAAIAAATPGAQVTVQHLDLASLDSIRVAAANLRSRHPRIDLLINNAGVMYTPRATTREGFELQLGVNHLGHFALTGLLLEAMLQVPGSRVVTVSSNAHRVRAGADFDDVRSERGYDRVSAYGRSKLANLLFTYELQRRLSAARAPTVALAAHPGSARTELFRNTPVPLRLLAGLIAPLIFQSAAMGALPVLRAATDPTAYGGQYFGPSGPAQLRGHPVVVRSSRRSYDTELQRRLWAISEEATGVTYPV